MSCLENQLFDALKISKNQTNFLTWCFDMSYRRTESFPFGEVFSIVSALDPGLRDMTDAHHWERVIPILNHDIFIDVSIFRFLFSRNR